MDGYDLDGTLADVNYDEANVRGLATVFSQAQVEYYPQSPFVVITARSHSTKELRDATEAWLQDNFTEYKGTYYVEGNEAQVIQAKADLIAELNLESFTDDNPAILAALADLVPAFVGLYTIEDGSRVRV